MSSSFSFVKKLTKRSYKTLCPCQLLNQKTFFKQHPPKLFTADSFFRFCKTKPLCYVKNSLAHQFCFMLLLSGDIQIIIDKVFFNMNTCPLYVIFYRLLCRRNWFLNVGISLFYSADKNTAQRIFAIDCKVKASCFLCSTVNLRLKRREFSIMMDIIDEESKILMWFEDKGFPLYQIRTHNSPTTIA